MMLSERNRWITEQGTRNSDMESSQKHGGVHLGPKKAKLEAMEQNMHGIAAEIKRLEASVHKNDRALRTHGVSHAY